MNSLPLMTFTFLSACALLACCAPTALKTERYCTVITIGGGGGEIFLVLRYRGISPRPFGEDYV